MTDFARVPQGRRLATGPGIHIGDDFAAADPLGPSGGTVGSRTVCRGLEVPAFAANQFCAEQSHADDFPDSSCARRVSARSRCVLGGFVGHAVIRVAPLSAQGGIDSVRSGVAAEPGYYCLHSSSAVTDRLGGRPCQSPTTTPPFHHAVVGRDGRRAGRGHVRADRLLYAVHLLVWLVEPLRAARISIASAIPWNVKAHSHVLTKSPDAMT